jgi:cytoskeletal protein CcmA (bactofilin family)
MQNNTDSQKVTVIEEGTEFRGSLTSSCAILVRGKISGEIAGPALSVTNTGVVAGRIKVSSLGSEGELSGEIEADEVTLAGRVDDGTVIRAKSLEARLSSEGGMTVTFGNARLEVGDEPNNPSP